VIEPNIYHGCYSLRAHVHVISICIGADSGDILNFLFLLGGLSPSSSSSFYSTGICHFMVIERREKILVLHVIVYHQVLHASRSLGITTKPKLDRSIPSSFSSRHRSAVSISCSKPGLVQYSHIREVGDGCNPRMKQIPWKLVL
jgi:hypothetical protein